VGGQVTDLTPLQLAGNNSVAFNLNFEQIPDRFFAGNRLYFEFGLSRDSAVAGRTIKYDRRFLDFEGLHISRTNHSALSAVQISWIIAMSILYAPPYHCTHAAHTHGSPRPPAKTADSSSWCWWAIGSGTRSSLAVVPRSTITNWHDRQPPFLFFPPPPTVRSSFLLPPLSFAVVCLFLNQLPLYSLPCNYTAG
jgi:hypothetical protein